MPHKLNTRRWSRQTILPELGEAGQQKLLDARVLCIGTGALGSSATLYLAAAGVGTLVICDPDLVEETNLQRQVIHGQSDIGKQKIHSAAARLLESNPAIKLELHACLLTPENALELAKGCDVIIDGSDNFPTRFLTNDTAFFLKIPLVHAAIQMWQGQLTVFAPHLGTPCYRCILPALPPPGAVPSCAEAGVIGALPGVMGSMQALEAIKLITGAGTAALGKLLCYDALHVSTKIITLRADSACSLCGKKSNIFSVHNSETTAHNHCTMLQEIPVQELQDMISAHENFYLLDVRTEQEYEEASIAGSHLIPLNELPARIGELPKEIPIVVHCKLGGRSAKACQFLSENGYPNVTNVAGGIEAWIEEGYSVN